MNNDQLQIVIKAQDQASSQINAIKDQLNKLSGSGDSAGMSFSKMSMAMAAGNAIWDITKSAVTSATQAIVGFVETASGVEMLRASLDTLTGSAENGKKMFASLYEMAAKTPFETKDLASATQTLLGFGEAQKDIIPDLQMLGDVSMGNAEKLQGLALVYAQVQSQGKLMGQDMLQMINNGFNPLKEISRTTGKSMAYLKDQMAAGAISADMVKKAFKSATAQGGLFYGGMDKGAKTLQGTWSTLMDGITMMTNKLVGLSNTGEVIQGGLFDKLKKGIDILNTWFNNNQDTIDKWGQTVGIVIESAQKTIEDLTRSVIEIGKKVGDYLMPKFKDLWKEIENDVIPVLKDLWKNVIEPLIPVVGETLVGAFGLLLDTTKNIIKFFADMIKGFQDGDPVIRALAAAFTVLASALAISSAISAISTAFGILTTVTIPAVTLAVGGLATFLGTPIVMAAIVTTAAVAAITGVITAANNAWDAINNLKIAQQNELNVVKDVIKRNAEVQASGVYSQAYKNTWQATTDKSVNSMTKPFSLFAKGTDYAPGGMAIVGEEGPELINLPRGSKVTPNNKLGQSISNRTTTIQNVYLGDGSAVTAFFNKIDQDNILVGKGLTPARGN